MAPHPRQASSDPFSPTANPSAYVPRTATEAVLVQLEMALEDGSHVLLLEGPPGAGKTTLLHVLAERLDGLFQPVYLPYPKLSPKEFCQWGLAALNEPPNSRPEIALRSRISRDACVGFPPLLWMVDDAGWMPQATLRRMLELQVDYVDAMRTLLVVPGRLSLEWIEESGLASERVELVGRMDQHEMGRYVKARLDRSVADASSRERFEQALPQLYRQSDGNPGQLHAAASRLMCRGSNERDTPSDASATQSVQT